MTPTGYAVLAGICLGLALMALVVTFFAWRSRAKLLGRLVALVVLTASFLALTLLGRHVDQDSYARCTDRITNTNRLNVFYRGMVALELGNNFIDNTLRAERVALYRSALLAPPNCGTKP